MKNTSISTKFCSLQQYPNNLFFLFHERKGFVTHQENKSDGNEIEFLFLNIFRTLWGIKRLHTLVETNSHAIKAILEVKTE